MSRQRLLVGMALAGLCLGGVGGCIDEDLINPMSARQPKVQPYGESDFYDDGLAMRTPPAGTVPRERITLNPGLTAGKVPGTPADIYLTAIPLPVDQALLDLGRKRFDIICATCHGPAGDGESIVAHQMALRPPPSLMKYLDKPPGYFFEVMTKGFGLMASYAQEMSIKERWAVVAYVRALQLSQTATLDKVPQAERARLEKEAP